MFIVYSRTVISGGTLFILDRKYPEIHVYFRTVIYGDTPDSETPEQDMEEPLWLREILLTNFKSINQINQK